MRLIQSQSLAKVAVTFVAAIGLFSTISQTANAQQTLVGALPTAPVVDDGFTFYNVENAAISGSTPPASEWWLQANIRVIGNIPARSVLKYTLSHGRTRLGEVRCETRTVYSANRPDESYPHVFATRCQDRNLRVRELGEFQVEWSMIDGNTDAVTPLATHTITVRSAPRFDVGTQRPWYPTPYVDRHGELFSSVLWQHPNGLAPYETAGIQIQPGARIDISVNASPQWGTNAVQLNSGVLRCRVDGTAVDFNTPYAVGHTSGNRTDEIRVAETMATMGEAMVPNPSGNPRYDNVQYLFRRYLLALPLTFGPSGSPGQRPDATPVADHPGHWECDWRTRDARTLRTFRFVVNAEGYVEPHAEQAEGLNFLPGAVFVETVIPENNPLDFRTLPEASHTQAFSGRGLRSAEARALSNGLRPVGQATPSGNTRPTSAGAARRQRR